MEELFARVERTVPRVQVVSPYQPGEARQISENGAIAYAEVNLADRPDADFQSAADEIKAEAEDVNVSGLRVELGGELFIEEELPASEAIGILLAIVVLLIAFGSVLAAGLPILTALFGIGTGIALVQITANGLTMPDFTTQAVAMIGIGVGIDYALLIVTRYRQALRDGHQRESAVALAADTAGRSVVFAGSTVVIAVLGMLLINVPAVQGLAVGISLGVLMTMLAAITLLPAVLGFVGHNIDKLGLPHKKRAEGEVRESRSGTGGAGSSSGARGRPRSPGSSSSSCWRCRCCRCGSRSPTPATGPPPTPRGAPTTCSSRASGPASTAQ
jgi:putative drug exporter of the RND superfamily